MELDPVIHAPTRLQIVSLLAAADEAEFAFVRDTLGVSAGKGRAAFTAYVENLQRIVAPSGLSVVPDERG
ncbi:hypothetical protein [Microbispora rosea]|uniref:hypothetical protein n=1 Tax=Microbispora rosea TaxID=58117 RepID=UPI003443CA37